MSTRRILNFLTAVCAIFAVQMGPVSAHAYSVSQEAQWKADVAEAKARAKDFEKHLERQRAADRERESAAQEIKKERAQDDKRYERMREEFIVDARRPDPFVVEHKLEVEHEKELQAEAREYEKLRMKYVSGQNRVEETMKKEAYIDPAREYSVRSAQSIEEQNKIPLEKPLLKFDVKKASETPR